MAELTALLLLVFCHAFFPSAESALIVSAPPSETVELGNDVTIPCTFEVEKTTINLQYLAIVWEFQGSAIVKFDNKGAQNLPNKYMKNPGPENGVADLYVRNASVSDIGTYRCTVVYSPDTVHKEIDLKLYARPSISSVEKVNIGHEQDQISCSVTRFYPGKITVELVKDGTVVNVCGLSRSDKNNDGTFSMNCTLTLPSTEKPKSLSCRVLHESLPEPIKQDIRLLYNDDGGDTTGVVVGVIVGVAVLIVLLIIAVVLYKKKSGNSDVLVSKILGTKMMEGETTTLHCTSYNRSQETKVKWIINNKDGTTCEITETRWEDNEDQQPLMSTEYKVSTEKTSSQKKKSLHDITTKLTFIPSVSRHLGSTVTCRFTDKGSEETTHKINDIYAKPQFMEPIQFTITDLGDVQVAASFSRFHPKPLQISWSSIKGQSQQKLPSEEEDKKNPDATFNLTSKCTISGDVFKDSTNKVTITWNHESMDKPQTRELSAKDLPWRPQVRDTIDHVIHGNEILFRCSVSNYFPDALTVKWFEKKKDRPDLIEVSESEKYTVPKIISDRTDKKTFTATSCLSVKKSLCTDEDVVFICRVDHPGLDEAIEAQTAEARDTEVQTFFVNNIQGPQKWYDGEKVVLYCAASYCTQDTQVTWIVTEKDGTEHEIREDSGGAIMKKDSGRYMEFVAHRERTDMSDVQGLLDVTSCLSFTPSVSKHKSITISCRISCEGRIREKTFQRKQLYAKPKVLNPIKLSLTDSGEVLCTLHIEEFYPSDIQIKWNGKENPSSGKTVKNADGSYTLESECKLPGSFFRDPQSTVKVSWRHESMNDWEWREMSPVDKDFPWKPELREIPVPNLLAGITATLKCEVSNVFPDVLSVKWLRKEKDSPDIYPLVHGDRYMISDVTPERQKDHTFTYRACVKFTPSVTSDQGTEITFRVEHPSLGKPAERSTGPLSIQDVQSVAASQENTQTDSALQDGIKDQQTTEPQKNLIVGDIRGRDQWTQGRKVTLQCPVSYCPEDVTVVWTVTEKDGKIQEVSTVIDQPSKEREVLKTSGYFLTKETEESDIKGLYNVTSILSFMPTVQRHYGSLITCRVTSNGETKDKKLQPKSVHAKPQVLDPVSASLAESGDVTCSLNLQNFYPKHITVKWTTEQNPLKSTDNLQENPDHTYNVCSRCTVQKTLFKDPNFKLNVTWSHKTMKEKGTRVLTRSEIVNSFLWRPVMQEVPVPRVLIGRPNTFQYNISRYRPDAVTVSWYKKEKGQMESLHDNDKYKTSITESQVQPDSTFSCTARLLFTPTVKDQESEIICRVEHPSLETPLERSSGVLRVQSIPKNRKPFRVTPGKEEVKYSLIIESFYPKDIQIQWFYVSEEETQPRPSAERYQTNMDKSFTVPTECKISQKDVKKPNSKIRVTWSHESMDDPESKEMCIGGKGSGDNDVNDLTDLFNTASINS
ncbi:uncharacterized protein ACNLHF_025119 [Anomaloglossus baeobatrachus]|uniref:uncharacterized protein LOC142245628 n=1 Tax=Anomaloglossus baeobatrachus TaxID=238106 RepID=UPI003F4FFD60